MLPSHDRYDFSSIDERVDYSWPGGRRLAFYLAVNIEHFAFRAGRGLDPVDRSGLQTHRNFAWRDYGNRVGVWRLFETIEEFRLPASVLLNGQVAELYPDLVDKIKERGDDVIGHGRTNSEALADNWEPEEKRLIAETTEAIVKAFGVRPTGWMGPSALESKVTPDILREAGYTHVLDWPMDDQPVWMRTRAGPLLSIPYPLELNDSGMLVQRDHTGREFADMMVDQFDQMVENSEQQPLVYALSLHGFIIGQPFRLRPFRQALRHCVNHQHKDRVWYTRVGDIVDHCLALPQGTIPGG